MRKEFLSLLGSAEAFVSLGVGAGGDVMKKIDLVAEKALTDFLQDQKISYTLISEETGVRTFGSHPTDFYLTVDPVDGTTNTIRGIPFAATSIAVSKAPYLRSIEAALVADLFHDVTYTAALGYGAFRNGEKIYTSNRPSLDEAVLGVDFNTFEVEEIVKSLIPILEKVDHIRHLGANALEICYVADGTIDLFIDLRGKLRVTDIAGAYLILCESGGLMISPSGAKVDVPLTPTQRVSFIAASNLSIYQNIKSYLN
jgi:myo-inositol-1(or 4)-monophosphatase